MSYLHAPYGMMPMQPMQPGVTMMPMPLQPTMVMAPAMQPAMHMVPVYSEPRVIERPVPRERTVVREKKVYYVRDVQRPPPPDRKARVAGGWKVVDGRDGQAKDELFYGRFTPVGSTTQLLSRSASEVSLRSRPRSAHVSSRGSLHGSTTSLHASRASLHDSRASLHGASQSSLDELHARMDEYESLAAPLVIEVVTPTKSLLGGSRSRQDLYESPQTMPLSRSSRSRSLLALQAREDLTSPVDWPGTEFGRAMGE